MSDVFRATARFIQNVPLGHDQSGKSTVSFYKDADDLIYHFVSSAPTKGERRLKKELELERVAVVTVHHPIVMHGDRDEIVRKIIRVADDCLVAKGKIVRNDYGYSFWV